MASINKNVDAYASERYIGISQKVVLWSLKYVIGDIIYEY